MAPVRVEAVEQRGVREGGDRRLSQRRVVVKRSPRVYAIGTTSRDTRRSTSASRVGLPRRRHGGATQPHPASRRAPVPGRPRDRARAGLAGSLLERVDERVRRPRSRAAAPGLARSRRRRAGRCACRGRGSPRRSCPRCRRACATTSPFRPRRAPASSTAPITALTSAPAGCSLMLAKIDGTPIPQNDWSPARSVRRPENSCPACARRACPREPPAPRRRSCRRRRCCPPRRSNRRSRVRRRAASELLPVRVGVPRRAGQRPCECSTRTRPAGPGASARGRARRTSCDLEHGGGARAAAVHDAVVPGVVVTAQEHERAAVAARPGEVADEDRRPTPARVHRRVDADDDLARADRLRSSRPVSCATVTTVVCGRSSILSSSDCPRPARCTSRAGARADHVHLGERAVAPRRDRRRRRGDAVDEDRRARASAAA